jgi:serine/threonine-protein kinase
MQHGNIVSVLDLAREGDDVFLVMEFVDGPSLRQLIKARGTRGLSLGVATYIAQSAAAGLEFAHVRPGGAIIHADISPSNLLLTTSGEVRVADFGIARREGLGQGVVEGKWAYMAPEQARGESLTPRSDVFALGVVLYELLTGQHPFGRAVTPDQRDDQMRVIPPRVVKPTVPHGLDAICMRALAHDARDRYSRMQHLIDALVEERFANGYREGASDLAQAIREVAPRSDLGSPRTMHTDRPVTIVTRSLLREATPVPPRRPSHPPSYPPSYPLGPLDPPPRDEFPMQPTVAPTSARAIELPSNQFPAVATEGVETLLRAAEPPPNDFPAVPSSGEHTVARTVDQVALAEAANAAAALMQIPSQLRVDGAPMPPFRLLQSSLPGDELASVVGGHTLTGHPAAAVALENRSNRWTIVVLAAAALIGVGAAIAIQLTPDEPAASAPARIPPSQPAQPVPAKPADQAVQDPQLAPASAPAPAAAPAPEPALAPTIPEPARGDTTAPPAAPTASPPATVPGGSPDTAPAASPASSASSTDAVHADTASAQGAAPSADVGAPSASPVDPGSPPRSDDAKPGARRNPARDGARRKAPPGILSVQAVSSLGRPAWAWVTVGNQRKETPDKFYLPPGSYTVKFYNEENGVAKTERVTIESGKLVRIDEDMEP